ncbi:MAG: aspartyl protease family protein [Nanoarchaeota archaeon]
MALSFKYKSIQRPNGIGVKSPVIPVVLSGNGSIKQEFVALIDSGADLSVIPEDVAELLNLNLKKTIEKSRGIGGEVDVKNTEMNLSIKKGHESYTFSIPVQVVLGDSKIPPLLGRRGFFDKFRITFDQANFSISLKRNTER